MKLGDFTELAKTYVNRPAYSSQIIDAISKYIDGYNKDNFYVSEIGAGTGKLTKILLEKGMNVTAVEPNDQMREEGILCTDQYDIEWVKGSGEATNLNSNTFDWAVMASSFHWTDPLLSLPEIYRVLKPGGFFTVIWNPRDIESSRLLIDIENIIYNMVPNLNRVSSGSKAHTKKWDKVLTSTGHFDKAIFMESDHVEIMSKERFMGAWRSVNDVRAQAGEEIFEEILISIENAIDHLDEITVPYKMRAWTVKKN